jgi:hypothetical protein
LNDADFLQALETASLPPAQFDHLGHVRMAYLYLCLLPFEAALAKIGSVIQAYARSLGQETRYDPTMTRAYVTLIRMHLDARGDCGGWPDFARRNPELFAADALSSASSSDPHRAAQSS